MSPPVWVAFACGGVMGTFVGILLAGLMVAAGRADDAPIEGRITTRNDGEEPLHLWGPGADARPETFH